MPETRYSGHYSMTMPYLGFDKEGKRCNRTNKLSQQGLPLQQQVPATVAQTDASPPDKSVRSAHTPSPAAGRVSTTLPAGQVPADTSSWSSKKPYLFLKCPICTSQARDTLTLLDIYVFLPETWQEG